MSTRYPDPFDTASVEAQLARIASLTPATPAQWGRMTVAQMLAHCCVAYEMAYTDRHPRPNALVRWVLRTFVKRGVVGPTPYRRSSPTAPAFRITDTREFATERDRLVTWIRRVRDDGAAAFDGRPSPSFGPLTADEWRVLFGKHLDHHLTQFGV